MTEHIDRFSEVAKGYARYRPTYPKGLYEHIFSSCHQYNIAWDVGTGNGQVATILAGRFSQVYATDISPQQIAQAREHPRIIYKEVPAENSHLLEHCADLITVAQAVHWFDLPAFAEEVRRVGRHEALLAIWGYGLLSATPAIDAVIRRLFDDLLDGYWDPQRRMIDNAYVDIHMPFSEIACPGFTFQSVLGPDMLLGYLRTWSATNNYRKQHGTDPVLIIESELREAFDGETVMFSTPVFLRMWRIT